MLALNIYQLHQSFHELPKRFTRPAAVRATIPSASAQFSQYDNTKAPYLPSIGTDALEPSVTTLKI
jgi:hypothetical protein